LTVLLATDRLPLSKGHGRAAARLGWTGKDFWKRLLDPRED
jgi:hypothetical protein